MFIPKPLAALCAAPLAIFAMAANARAHGFVGIRFFPPTITTEDPLAADELALPTFSLLYVPRSEESPESRVIDAGFEFSKLIFPKLTVGISQDYLFQRPHNAHASHGADNLVLSLKYEAWRDDAHEAIFSLGLEAEIGGTGSKSIGRNSFTTFIPTLYFGKGFGDLPDSLEFLKPFALTGSVGLVLPTEAAEPNALEWGFALQYNLPYLQQHVRDIGLPAPFKNMIPLIEYTFETPFNRGEHGFESGTVNPGILWESKYCQLGVEALIPVNPGNGQHIGAVVQLQIYIDDLFPKLFGHPVFGD